MKLNLGCGKEYKKGFINIDNYDPTIADKLMDATKLEYSANSIEEIHANQLIEHLGFFKTIYAIAEWYRVLKPDGELLIETPNLEESFSQFIQGDIEIKKRIVTWIFGLESKGMTHVFCYPTELLQTILNKTGFKIIEKSLFEKEKNHPSIRIKCKKTTDYEMYQLLSNFRSKLLEKKVVNFNDFFTTLEQEKLIDFFILKTRDYLQNKNTEALNQIIIEGAIHNPEISLILIQELSHNDDIQINTKKDYEQILTFLMSINYPNILFNLIKKSPVLAGTQNKTYQTVLNIGRETIKKMLSSKENNIKIQKSISNLSKEFDLSEKNFLSEILISLKAEKYFRLAIKEFYLEKYTEALGLINMSLQLERNYVLYYWNQARLYMILKDFQTAKKSYENVLELVKNSDDKQKEKILRFIEDEQNNFTLETYGKPILEVKHELQ
jgi:hypothetical protein